MAEMFTVHFSVQGEPTSADVEFRGNATILANRLHDQHLIDNVKVTDEFSRTDEGYPETVYVPGGDA